ncbi:hypothetical protein ElyMa_002064000 [Elysia marginata]|uniref:Uncharacterized protein n=1 Tax=Elysia marginata TaxID=1093978 RepID=A0AAV4FAT0_9GAST|nr:hypothetical protein ElyMa_002064000 [Elysia marginata]
MATPLKDWSKLEEDEDTRDIWPPDQCINVPNTASEKQFVARPGLLRRGVVLQHHMRPLIQQTLHSNGYSTTVRKFFLLLPTAWSLEASFRRHGFRTEGDLVDELKNRFAHLDLGFFRVGIYSLLSRLKKCTDLHTDYVGK